MKSIRFSPSSKNIQSLRIFNCKTLQHLEGLGHLCELRSVQIGMTALEIDSLLQQRLAKSLKVFAFYTGKEKENSTIRAKLDGLGYREYDEANR